jgi:hypothetical protein
MNQKARKKSGRRLRELGCPDTLIKDERRKRCGSRCDVQRGAGTVEEQRFESTEESGSSKAEAALIASKAKPARLYSGT